MSTWRRSSGAESTTGQRGAASRAMSISVVGWPGRSAAAAGSLSAGADGELQPVERRLAERWPARMREGWRRIRHISGDAGMSAATRGGKPCFPAGRRDGRPAHPVFGQSVAGERGSPDTWRDPRGFAVKFYTTEGNFDLVGNNTPVFFVRDPLKFQHFIRSQKRRADNNLRDHDMQWDFWTLSPESAHQVTWLMGDRGIPRTWRHMNGYSSHTYLWINGDGERFWVKYHFKTDQGVEFFTQDEGDQLASVDTDYHQRDLYDHIEAWEFPSWTLRMQIMPFEDARTYRFNPFDLTKVWPHGDYPLVEVGRMTLNRNLTDYHTEMEQAAFEPNNLVAGTGLSPDKMLLARGFSYSDAHRARLGVNYRQIPVNAPKVPMHSYSKDGAMRVQNVSGPSICA